MDQIKNISVIGDGGWGTTLAAHLGKKGYPVKLWSPFPRYAKKIEKNRYNSKFLPGIRIPKTVSVTSNLKHALADSELIVFAVPSKYTLSVLKKIKNLKLKYSGRIFLSVTKGIEAKSLRRMSEIIHHTLGKVPLAVLSGPTIAIEVASRIPSTAVVAAQNSKIAKKIQHVFNSPTFRIYTNNDIVGVEIGGSIKNIIAIACGICDGLGFGSNTKSAILTRGLAEMARLGKSLGAKPKTFSGLSGLGDLVTTCFSPKSRNRFVGEQLGKGTPIRKILASMEMVAEGVETVKAAYALSQKHKISMPITEAIYQIIYKRKKASLAVTELMTRKTRAE